MALVGFPKLPRILAGKSDVGFGLRCCCIVLLPADGMFCKHLKMEREVRGAEEHPAGGVPAQRHDGRAAVPAAG